MFGGVLIVGSIVLAVGGTCVPLSPRSRVSSLNSVLVIELLAVGVVLLIGVGVGGTMMLYYLGKNAYYENFGKRAGVGLSTVVNASRHVRPTGVAGMMAGVLPIVAYAARVRFSFNHNCGDCWRASAIMPA